MNASLWFRLVVAALVAVVSTVAISAEDPISGAATPGSANFLTGGKWISERCRAGWTATSKVVSLTNRSTAPVHIAHVPMSTPGLRDLQIDKRMLQPGESSAIEFQFDTRRYRGRKDSAFTVAFDRPEFAEVRDQSGRGEIRSGILIRPSRSVRYRHSQCRGNRLQNDRDQVCRRPGMEDRVGKIP